MSEEYLSTTAEEYLAMSPDERIELLKAGLIAREEFRKLRPSEQVDLMNSRLKAKGAYYDNGGIFGRSPHTALGILNGIEAAQK